MIKRFVGTSNFPYAIDFEQLPDLETLEWCKEQFGPSFNSNDNNINECKWIITMFGVRFKKQEYQNWFLMRWS